MRRTVSAGVMAMTMAGGAGTAPPERTPFGTLPDGRAVEKITLTDGRLSVAIITWGAGIQSVLVPDRAGRVADVALGYSTLAGYLAKSEYFGVVVGRVANRIAGGTFSLDGKAYRVPVNNGANSLHGGTAGFDKQLWRVIATTGGDRPSVTLGLTSPDGDQGYPGTVTVTARYALEDGAIAIDYSAITDRPTVVNLSNHAYWNLAGEGDPGGAMGHVLTIPAETFLPTDSGAIPTGEFRPVAGTAFDFRKATPVGARVRDASDEQIRFGKGYDHNWVIDRKMSETPRLVARVEEPMTGRVLEVLSNQPGLQFYSGNFLDGTVVGKSGRLYRQGDTVVLEPQMFPDTPNQPAFGSVRLDPGQTYVNRIRYRFSVVK